jgi:hypothetical protein
MNIYLTKHFWGYEQLNPPPKNLPDNMKTIYVTDNKEYEKTLLDLGWDMVSVITDYVNVTDLRERRLIISEINCFPLKFIPKLSEFKYIFMCDSNVITLWKDYIKFVNGCADDKCLFTTTDWYDGERNNIISEYLASSQPRWEYSYESMGVSKDEYIRVFNKLDVDVNSVGVCSAKYFGWNTHHPMYDEMSKHLYEEYTKHIQGNIILSYMGVVYDNFILKYKGNYDGGLVSSHNFQA